MALVAGAADAELSAAATSLTAKVEQVLPPSRLLPAAHWGFAVYPSVENGRGSARLPVLRRAVRERRKVELTYCRADGASSRRVVRPLQVEYWGRVWTCTTWCELRSEFREFRLDRIDKAFLLDDVFIAEPGKALIDFINITEGRRHADDR